MDKQKPKGAVTPKTVVMRQLIVSAVALAIVGVGIWSLLHLSAPYHPAVPDGDVTRGTGAGVTLIGD